MINKLKSEPAKPKLIKQITYYPRFKKGMKKESGVLE